MSCLTNLKEIRYCKRTAHPATALEQPLVRVQDQEDRPPRQHAKHSCTHHLPLSWTRRALSTTPNNAQQHQCSIASRAAHPADSSAPALENVSGVRTKKSEMWMAGLASRNTSLPRAHATIGAART